MRLRLASTLFMLLLSCAAIAQVNVPYQPFGRIVSADIRPSDLGQISVGRLAAAAASGGPFAFGSLSFKDSDASDSGTFSLGYGTALAGHDFLVLGSYSHVRPQSGGGHDRATAYTEISLGENSLAAVSGSVAAVYDPDSFKLYNPVLAADHTFIPKTLKMTVNLGWIEISPKSGSAIHDFQPSAGLSWSPDKLHLWSISSDYTLKNDVDGEDTGSASVARTFPTVGIKIKAGLEKHNVLSLSLTRFF
jgi:hypothetical protein